MNNRYLIENLDNFMVLSASAKKYYDRFASELIHSSFLIAHDENRNPIVLSVDNKDYAFIFTDGEEFKKAFPSEDVSAREFEFTTLRKILKFFKLSGFILNVSSQNFYITKEFSNGLNDLPSDLISSSKTYEPEELKDLKNSLNNEHLEDFIKTPGNYEELFEIISSTVLFGLLVSDKDMDILERDGIIETYGLEDKYDFHIHNQYLSMFTSEEKIRNVETSKFKYSSLVNFASLAHYSIKQELRGIIINPEDENYVIPVEVLLENWSLINRTCWDERLTLKNCLFLIDD